MLECLTHVSGLYSAIADAVKAADHSTTADQVFVNRGATYNMQCHDTAYSVCVMTAPSLNMVHTGCV